MSKIIPFFLLPLLSTCLHLHNFYAMERTSIVSNSDSIKQLNECKALCLDMGEFFPYQFKYHRYILRQKVGDSKYFEGTCWYSQGNEQIWHPFKQLQAQIIKPLFVDMTLLQRWQNFDYKCQDLKLKVDQKLLKDLGFTRVHSNFEYYDDGTFKNLEPFDDLNDLLNDVLNR